MLRNHLISHTFLRVRLLTIEQILITKIFVTNDNLLGISYIIFYKLHVFDSIFLDLFIISSFNIYNFGIIIRNKLKLALKISHQFHQCIKKSIVSLHSGICDLVLLVDSLCLYSQIILILISSKFDIHSFEFLVILHTTQIRKSNAKLFV